ncbi:MAG: GrpB family protein [Sphaerospermopsis sp. SIO1G1]|nr:GrpB family protein [Sphaerospermopsis sp. SIO1G1]
MKNQIRKVEVVSHDPDWKNNFLAESQNIQIALSENLVRIHHIGSTAIPGIYAKPIIDILLEVREIEEVDIKNSDMEILGYQVMGEFGIPNRRFFRKQNQAGIRTHHVHAFEIGSVHIERHLAFRDYMISHPQDAHQYSKLKRELAQKYPHDIDSYIDGKNDFVKEKEIKAKDWYISYK